MQPRFSQENIDQNIKKVEVLEEVAKRKAEARVLLAAALAPLGAVQMPVATDWVRWAATTRAEGDKQDGRAPHPLLVADAVERLAMLGSTGPAYKTWPLLDDAVDDLGTAISRKGGEPPRRRLETGRRR